MSASTVMEMSECVAMEWLRPVEVRHIVPVSHARVIACLLPSHRASLRLIRRDCA